MEIKQLEWQKRADETVLLYKGKTVGMYLPTHDPKLPWRGVLLPVPGYFPDASVGLVNTVVDCHYEVSAQLWVLGVYMTILSRMGALLPLAEMPSFEVFKS